MDDFLPLSGAVFVSNPRKLDRSDPMSGVFGDMSGLALTNGVRRRANAIRRAAKLDMSMEDAAAAINERVPPAPGQSSGPDGMVNKLSRLLFERRRKLQAETIASYGGDPSAVLSVKRGYGNFLKDTAKVQLGDIFKKKTKAADLKQYAKDRNKARRAAFKIDGNRMQAKNEKFDATGYATYHMAVSPAQQYVVKGKYKTTKQMGWGDPIRARKRIYDGPNGVKEYNAKSVAIRGLSDKARDGKGRKGMASRGQIVQVYGDGSGAEAILFKGIDGDNRRSRYDSHKDTARGPYPRNARVGRIKAASHLHTPEMKAKAKAAAQAARDAKNAKKNPGVFGGLALTNGGFGGLAVSNPSREETVTYLKSAATLAGGAAAGGYAHFLIVPHLDDLVEEYLPEWFADGWGYVNYLASGIALGAPIGILGKKIGGMAGLYTTVLGTGVIAAGGLLQLLKYSGRLAEEGAATKTNPFSGLGGLALTNPGVFGGVTVEPPPTGIFGGLGQMGAIGGVEMDPNAGVVGNYRAGDGQMVGYAPYGGISSDYSDGMAYMLAPLTSSDNNLYGEINHCAQQGLAGDAAYSGADFSVHEGQALVNGPKAFVDRFGMAPIRVNNMGGQVGAASHLAGREGWRWAWLIKMIGFENAQKLAALPAAKRLIVLKQMKEKALTAYQSAVAGMASSTAPQVIASQVGQGNDSDPYAVSLANRDREFAQQGGLTGSADGISSMYAGDDAYGAMLFSGADYL